MPDSSSPDPFGAEKWWRAVFPTADRDVYDRYRSPITRVPNLANSALLIVDATIEFLGSNVETAEAVKENPTACGSAGWHAVANIARLLDRYRHHGWPVIFTVPDWANQAASGSATAGPDRQVSEGFGTMPPEIAPIAGEVVQARSRPSAFFGTTLPSLLIRLRASDLLIVGGTTSGCVRASVVDASSYGLSVTLIHDACFDRSRLSHGVSLFEMERKHAAVLGTGEIVEMATDSGPAKVS